MRSDLEIDVDCVLVVESSVEFAVRQKCAANATDERGSVKLFGRSQVTRSVLEVRSEPCFSADKLCREMWLATTVCILWGRQHLVEVRELANQ